MPWRQLLSLNVTRKTKFDWFREYMLQTKSAFISWLNISITRVFKWKKGIGTNLHVSNRILWRTADLDWRPVNCPKICSDSNPKHSYFRCLFGKAWKRSLAWVTINQNHSFQPKWSHMKREVDSYIETCIDWTSFDFRFKSLLTICLRKSSSTMLLTDE